MQPTHFQSRLDLCTPGKVHQAILKITDDGEGKRKEELSPLQQAMVEWYIEQPAELQEYISSLCSQIINSLVHKRGDARKVWFGPISAIQILGVLVVMQNRWKRFNR